MQFHEKNLPEALRISENIEKMRRQKASLLSIEFGLWVPVEMADERTGQKSHHPEKLAMVVDIDENLIITVARTALIAELDRQIEHARDLLRRLGIQLEGDVPEKAEKGRGAKVINAKSKALPRQA